MTDEQTVDAVTAKLTGEPYVGQRVYWRTGRNHGVITGFSEYRGQRVVHVQLSDGPINLFAFALDYL